MSYNVNRSVTDAFYRYKMPKLMAKVEGKGNGIKTVIANMVDIGKALERPATYPCKYFGCELGAQTQFDFKNDRYIVNGSHDASKLQSLLDGFIRKFVLCPECDNPETDLIVNEKKGTIKQSCKACGHQSQLDMRHKVTTYILKNPPDVKPNQQGTSLTKKKDRTKKVDGDKNSLRPGSPKSDNRSDASDNDIIGDEEDDDWAVDVSADAVRERQMELASAGVKNLTLTDDLEKCVSERLELFFNYCKSKKDKGQLKPGAEMSVFKDIAGEAERLEIKESKAVMVLVELLFDKNIIKQTQQYRILLLLFTHGNQKAQKYLLGATEKLVELHKDMLLQKIPMVLKAIYDADIVEEEVLLEWGRKTSKKYVSKEVAAEMHVKAQPFLKWLQEAEEEEDSESDNEEDGVEIEYDDRSRARSLKEQEAKAAPVSRPAVAEVSNGGSSASDDEDDVDIDNI